MSKTVDKRVVELEFDNSRFEKNAKTSMSTLDKLKAKLNFTGATKGLEEFNKVADESDMGVLDSATDTIKAKFSALETIAIGALLNIGRKAEEAGAKLIRSLTTEQISAGFSKYERKTVAVQTIMNALTDTFASDADKMEYVTEQLEKLSWFSDETSYSFNDMVDNVGKFLNNGVKMDDAIKSMEGISTWAALSGANAEQASRAMYNLSQAMGVGYVQLIDWKSIENAQMATLEFKQMAIDAAIAEGTVRDLGNGLYEAVNSTAKDATFTLEKFNKQLTAGQWLTKNVLNKTLAKYGEFATKIQEASEAIENEGGELLVSKLAKYATKYAEGTLVIEDAAKDAGVSVEFLKDQLEILGTEEYALGRKAFIAAQSSRTFADVINYTKDAVSSGWMQTFEYIFGNYYEAVELWSDLSEWMYNVFVTGGEERNELLEKWREGNGRDFLIGNLEEPGALWNILNSILDVIKLVREGFREIFPPITAEKLVDLTKRFKEFTDGLKISEDAAEKIKGAFKGIFSVIKAGWEILKAGVTVVKPVFGFFVDVGKTLLGVFGRVSSGFADFMKSLLDEGTIQQKADEIAKWLSTVLGEVKGWLSGLDKVDFESLWSDIVSAFDWARGKLEEFWNWAQEWYKNIKGFFGGVEKTFKIKKNLTKNLTKAFGDLFSLPAKAAASQTTALSEGLSEFEETGLLPVLHGGVSGNSGTVAALEQSIEQDMTFYDKLRKFFDMAWPVVQDYGQRFINKAKEFGAKVTDFFKNADMATVLAWAKTFRRVANSVLRIIQGGLIVKLLNGFVGITKSVSKLVNESAKYVKALRKAKKFENVKAVATSFLMIAAGIFAIAYAVKTIADIKDTDKIWLAAGILAVFFAGIVAVMFMMGKYTREYDEKGKRLLKYDSTNMIKMAAAILIIGFALNLIGKAIKNIADIDDPKKIEYAAIALGAILGAIMLFLTIMSRDSRKIKKDKSWKSSSSDGDVMLEAAFSILIISGAVWIIGQALSSLSKAIGESGWDNMKRVLVALGEIFGGIVAIFAIMGILSRTKVVNGNELLKIAGSFAIMGVAMAIIVFALKEFEKIVGNKDFGLALATMGIIIVYMSAIFGLFGALDNFDVIKTDNLLKIAASFVVLAVAMLIAAVPLKMLSGLSKDELAPAVGAMIIMMGAMTLIMGLFAVLMSKAKVIKANDVLKVSASFILMSAAMLIVGIPLKKLAELDVDGGKIIAVAFALALIMIAMGAVAVALSKLAKNIGAALAGALAVIMLSASLLILVPVFKTLSEMALSGTVWTAMGAISLLLVEFLAIAVIFAFLKEKCISAIAGAAAVLILALAVDAIIPAFKAFGGMDWEESKKALKVIGLVLLEMGVVAAAFGLLGLLAIGSIAGATAILIIVHALEELIPTFKYFGNMEWESIKKAVYAIGSVLLAMSESVALLSLFGIFSIAGAEALLLTAEALAKVVPSMIILGYMDWNKTKKAVAAMGLVFEAMNKALFGNGSILANVAKMAKAAAFRTLAEAINTITTPLLTLSTIPWEDLKHAVDAMTEIFTAMNDAVKDSGFSDIFDVFKADAISLLGDAIAKLAPAVETLIKMDQDALANTLTVVSDAFVKFGEALDSTPWFDPVGRASGIAALIEHIQDLTEALPPFIELLNSDANGVEKSLGVLGDAFKDFGAAIDGDFWCNPEASANGIVALIGGINDLIGPLPRLMNILKDDKRAELAAASLTLIGGAFATFGASLKASPWWDAEGRGKGVQAITSTIPQIVGGIEKFIGLMGRVDTDAIKEGFRVLGFGYSELGKSLKDFPVDKDLDGLIQFGITFPAIADSYVKILNSVAKIGGFNELDQTWTPLTSEEIQSYMTSFVGLAGALGAMGEAVQKFGDSASANQIMNAITRNRSGIAGLFKDVANIDGVKMKKNFEDAKKDIEDFLGSLHSFATELAGVQFASQFATDSIETAGSNLGTAFKKALSDKLAEALSDVKSAILTMSLSIRLDRPAFYSAGAYIMEGLKSGIESKKAEVFRAVDLLAEQLAEEARKGFDEHSPSRVFAEIGRYVSEGLAVGIETYADKAMTASEAMADDTVTAANDALSDFGIDPNMTVTITPVLDLTQLGSGRSQIEDALGIIDMDTSLALAAQNAASMGRRQIVAEDGMSSLTRLIRDLVANPPSVNNNEFNISGADPDEVADAVEQRLTRDIVRRNAIWRS